MNYNTYYKNLRKKELMKTAIFTIFILLFTCISTYNIYNKFKDSRDEIMSSKSLNVTFHEKNEVTINKITPVSDSVGLSSKAYTFTIKNNTNKKVNYIVKIEKDTKTIKEDNCGEYQIPLNIIKTGIHQEGEVSQIYNLDDLEDGIITTRTIGPQKQTNYKIRFWISKNTLTLGADLHFHGIIKVVEG